MLFVFRSGFYHAPRSLCPSTQGPPDLGDDSGALDLVPPANVLSSTGISAPSVTEKKKSVFFVEAERGMGNCFRSQNKNNTLSADLVASQSWVRGGKRWVETADPETNHVYYFCHETGETRITLPPPAEHETSV